MFAMYVAAFLRDLNNETKNNKKAVTMTTEGDVLTIRGISKQCRSLRVYRRSGSCGQPLSGDELLDNDVEYVDEPEKTDGYHAINKIGLV